MKKVTAIFFFSVYLFSATESYQLLKLPIIFQHYAEHKIEDKSISFLQFLAMHYLQGNPKDKDYDRDMQLPFKTPVDLGYTITTASVPVILQFSIPDPLEISQSKKTIPQGQFISSSYLSAIWQPPKFYLQSFT